jgi:hypothetical protein
VPPMEINYDAISAIVGSRSAMFNMRGSSQTKAMIETLKEAHGGNINRMSRTLLLQPKTVKNLIKHSATRSLRTSFKALKTWYLKHKE